MKRFAKCMEAAMQHNERHERECKLLIDAGTLRQFPYLREAVIARPTVIDESKLASPMAKLFGYALTDTTVRIWFLFDGDADTENPRSGLGRVIDPRHAGYVGVAAGRLRERRKASAKVRAAMRGETVKRPRYKRILAWLGVRR
jgi:hypothetical protein